MCRFFWKTACWPWSLRPDRTALQSAAVVLHGVAAMAQSWTTVGDGHACARAVRAHVEMDVESQTWALLRAAMHETAAAATLGMKLAL